LPPQVTFADDVPVVALPPVALLSPPHADNISAPVARILSAAPNRLISNRIPLNGTDGTVVAGSSSLARARRTAVFLAAMKHSNKIALQPQFPTVYTVPTGRAS